MGKTNDSFKRIPDNLDVLQKQKGVVGAYLIVDNSTAKAYIGSTNDLLIRKGKHEALLNNNKHHNKNLQKAFNDGADLEFIGTTLPDRDTAYDFEQATIDEFHKSGLLFNRAINAREGHTGLPLSDETREKMRQSHLGKKLSPEQIEKIRIANTGRKMSDENKEQMRIRKTGLKASEETKQKLRDSHLGFVMPEEQKEKIRIANTGREVTEEHRKNLSIALTGKKFSERRIENMKLSAILNNKCKTVIGDKIEYSSIEEAARSVGIDARGIKYRIASPNFPNWNFK